MDFKEVVMTDDKNKRSSDKTRNVRSRENWLPGWPGREEFWKKGLACSGLFFMEWKLGQEGRPALIRLQELVFLFVLCRVAVTDARTRLIPDQYVGAIFALAGAGFL